MSAFMVSLVIKVTIVVALGLALTAVSRRAPAAFRHVVLLGTLVSALLVPVLIAIAPRWDVALLEPSAGEISRAGAPVVSTRPGSVTSIRQSASSLEPARWTLTNPGVPTLLLVIWLFGSLGVFGWLALGHLRLRSLAKKSWPLDGADWSRILREESAHANTEKTVRLLCHPDVSTPLTWGSLDPVVMFPEDALEWSEEHRRIVLRHELSHVERNDALAQLVAGITCAIYWFHPLVWIAERKLRAECERACDDRVLASGTPAPIYAAHLLEVARSARLFGGPGFLSVAMARPSQLEGRLLAVLSESRPRNAVAHRTRWLVFASIAVVALVVSAFRPVHRAGGAAILPAVATDSTFERAVDVRSGETLTLDIRRTGGTVTITGWDRPQVLVRARLGGSNWRETRVTLKPVSGGVLLRDNYVGRSGTTSFSHSFDIRVPRNFSVRLNSAGGGISISGVNGSFSGVTGGGEIRFDKAGGTVDLKTGGGDVNVTSSSLRGFVGTGGGNLNIDGGGKELVGSSGSGDITDHRELLPDLNATTPTEQLERAQELFEALKSNERAQEFLEASKSNERAQEFLEASKSNERAQEFLEASKSNERAQEFLEASKSNERAQEFLEASKSNEQLERAQELLEAWKESRSTTTFLMGDYPNSAKRFGQGGIQRHRSGGDITIGEAPNGARVSTGGGAIRIGPSGGEVYAKTGGGSIEIGPALGSVIATTGAGNIMVAFRGSGLHAADLTTGLGRVELILPANVNAELVLETAYTNNLAHKTRIESDWPLRITETDVWDGSVGTPRKYMRARQILGLGGGVIRVRTVNGNVIVRKADM